MGEKPVILVAKHHNETSFMRTMEKPLIQRFLFYVKGKYEMYGAEYKNIDV